MADNKNMANRGAAIMGGRLRLFIVISVVAHLVFVAGWGVPGYLRQRAEERQELAARVEAEETRVEAEEKRKAEEEAKKKAEEEARKLVQEQTKQDLTEQLKRDFEQVMGQHLPAPAAGGLWDEVLAALMAGLDGYVDALADQGVSEAELQQRLAELQGDMMDELLRRLREMTARQLADSFLSKVETDVAPKVAEHYQRQIGTRVGRPLQTAGQQIVRDERSLHQQQRTGVRQALVAAERLANSAQTELRRAATRLEQKAQAAARADSRTAAELKPLAAALRQLEEAEASVAKSAEKLATPELKQKVVETGGTHIAAAKRHLAGAESAVEARKAGEAVKEVAAAAEAARDLVGAIDEQKTEVAGTPAEVEEKGTAAAADLETARQSAETAAKALSEIQERLANADAAQQTEAEQLVQSTREEGAAISRAREHLESAEKSLREAAAASETLLPAVTEQIIATADVEAAAAQTGARAAATQAETGQAEPTASSVSEAAEQAGRLAEAVRDAREAAAKAEYDAVAQARATMKQTLDDTIKPELERTFREAYEASTVPRLTEKLTGTFERTLDLAGIEDEAIVREVEEKVRQVLGEDLPGTLDAGEIAADPLERAERLDAARAEDRVHDGRADAVAQQLQEQAQQIGEELAGIAADESGDGQFEGLAGAGEGVPQQELITHLAALADGLRSGRMTMLPGSAAGMGLGQLRRDAMQRGRIFDRLRRDMVITDPEEYARLVAGIHERDQEAARGEAIVRESVTGQAGVGEALEELVRASRVILPPEAEEPAVGKAEGAEPYQPTFTSIRYAAMPFLSEPITIDGDLDDWQDIPALPMQPGGAGVQDPNLAQPPQYFRAAWDNSGIYLAYDVDDPDQTITKVMPDNFWEGDGIEVWFDTLNAKETVRNARYTQQFWAWPSGQDGDETIVGGEAVIGGGDHSIVAYTNEQIQVASRQTPRGWTIEVFIPAGRIRGLDLTPGRIIGFNASLCTGTSLYYYWAGRTDVSTSMRPDTWGDMLLAGSEGKVEAPEKLAGELEDGETAATISSLVIGEPLRIRVTDADMSLSDREKDKVSVIVRSRSGGAETVILEETSETSGVFEGSIRTTLNYGEPVPEAVELYEGEPVEVLYIDQARPDGSRNVPIKLTLPTAAPVSNVAAR